MLNAKLIIFSCFLCMLCTIHWTRAQSQDPNHDKIRLYHHPNSVNVSERFDLVSSLDNAKLNRNKKVKLIVHGAGGHCLKDDVPFRIVKAYLRAKENGKEDYNVLCLDYDPLVQLGPLPGDPMPSVRKRYEYICDMVSEKAANLILEMEANGYVASLDDIHLIGHSLGGQVAGYIGRKIQEKSQKSLGRISGLDIANIFLIYSNEVNLNNQLDLSDAKFVDIIHTSQIGLKGNYGHLDVFPDGGLHQRSCMTKGPISNVTELIIGGCSHGIIGKYWENSIDSPNITACKDQSWESFEKKKSDDCPPEKSIVFGEYAPTDARGKYFLEYPLIEP